MSRVAGSGTREKRTVAVELDGRRFPIRSDDDEAYLQDLAGFVNARIERVRRATRKIDPGQVALLALLDVADELFRARAEHDKVKTEVEAKAETLLAAIDQMAETLEVREALAIAAPVGAGRRPAT